MSCAMQHNVLKKMPLTRSGLMHPEILLELLPPFLHFASICPMWACGSCCRSGIHNQLLCVSFCYNRSTSPLFVFYFIFVCFLKSVYCLVNQRSTLSFGCLNSCGGLHSPSKVTDSVFPPISYARAVWFWSYKTSGQRCSRAIKQKKLWERSVVSLVSTSISPQQFFFLC